MSIKYSIKKNNLTTDTDSYYGAVSINSSLDLDGIATRMVDLGSTITRTDIIAVLEDAIKATTQILLEGNRVNFGGLVQLYPVMKGQFNDITDSYSQTRHKVDVSARPGTQVRNAVRSQATVEKVHISKPGPVILQFNDNKSKQIDAVITAGQIGSINGIKLKYNPLQADEGIFLRKVSDATETKIEDVQRNKPSELVFLNPGTLVSDDQYQVVVRTRLTVGGELRQWVYETVLTVA